LKVTKYHFEDREEQMPIICIWLDEPWPSIFLRGHTKFGVTHHLPKRSTAFFKMISISFPRSTVCQPPSFFLFPILLAKLVIEMIFKANTKGQQKSSDLGLFGK
jgi:hypothetical protein